MSAKTRGIKGPQDIPATHADILAVIDAASASIAVLEARIMALEAVRQSPTVAVSEEVKLPIGGVESPETRQSIPDSPSVTQGVTAGSREDWLMLAERTPQEYQHD